jgi:hypothetical protein
MVCYLLCGLVYHLILLIRTQLLRSCICCCPHMMSDNVNGPDKAGLPYLRT